MRPNPLEPLLTEKEAAAFLQMAPRGLETMRRRGTGPPFVKPGHFVRYRRSDLEAWVESKVRTSTGGEKR